MKNLLNRKFWFTLVLFSLIGQVAWVVENMYFNVFIYKMFRASASDISLMVSASAICATLTTWLVGAFSDKVSKRKIFICGGYILWGISILAFALIRVDILTPIAGSTVAAMSLGVTLVIIMDCVMTFMGSSANDAAFNAWLTDVGDETNRGSIEGINSMMPLIAILVVFGSFMALDQDKPETWSLIFIIIGVIVLFVGVAGIFLIHDNVTSTPETKSFWNNIVYIFKPSTIKQNVLLYLIVAAFALFSVSIQIFMPYLILYYEKSLGLTNYVLILAPAIIVAAAITAVYGRLYDKLGFKRSIVFTVVLLMAGYVILYFFKSTPLVFIGSLFMMSGDLASTAVFVAVIRDKIPADKTGLFQGLRIIGAVLIPSTIGPWIGAFVLKNAEQVINSDGTTSFLPNENIWLAALVVAVILLAYLYAIFKIVRDSHFELTSIDETIGWRAHPTPSLMRDDFVNLNGEWMLDESPIQVPFPPQSRLSGFKGRIKKEMTYVKKFDYNLKHPDDRLVLHFGAVDQVAEVYLNGTFLGKHEGGYLPFSFDVTDALKQHNVLKVVAIDKNSLVYGYGKQYNERGGMWYTRVSGIWKTVCAEEVPANYIKDIKILPLKDGIKISMDSTCKNFKISVLAPAVYSDSCYTYPEAFYCCGIKGKNSSTIYENTFDGSKAEVHLQKEHIKRWSPEAPYLYQMKIEAENDVIYSYFALRDISIAGNKLLLNGEPIFMNGLLDSGYYCDGIFLPANEQVMIGDIAHMKELGYNMLRKHIKIEPEIYYFTCDRLGMMVVQDMVNSGRYAFWKDTALPNIGKVNRKDTGLHVSEKRRNQFKCEVASTINYVFNHPCVVGYTIFNEGWGQFESDSAYDFVKSLDSSRFIDSTSGWFAQKKSDVDSEHVYLRTEELKPKDRPMFLSECGGFTLPLEGHEFAKYSTYGYGTCINIDDLTDKIVEMYETMVIPAIKDGLCGCVYTQVSDVEDELNGIYTFDRKVCKVDQKRIKQLNSRLQ